MVGSILVQHSKPPVKVARPAAAPTLTEGFSAVWGADISPKGQSALWAAKTSLRKGQSVRCRKSGPKTTRLWSLGLRSEKPSTACRLLPAVHCRSIPAGRPLQVDPRRSSSAGRPLPVVLCKSIPAGRPLQVDPRRSSTASRSPPVVHCRSIPAGRPLPGLSPFGPTPPC